MSEWQTRTLGELGVVQSGFAFKSRDWVDSGVPVVKIQNVRGGRVDLSGCSFVSPDVAKGASRYRLEDGDVLVTMSGEIGAIGIVRSPDHIMLNQRVGRIRLHEDDPVLLSFIAYALQDPERKAMMVNSAYGVAQPNISPSLLAKLPIELPPPELRAKVVSILSGLEDLAANNRRRADVLEEMARTIYREWFVRFRFPGHESAELVDSAVGPIPNDWELKTVGNVVELKYGKALKADARAGGDVAVVGSSGIVGWHDQDLVSGPAIVVGRKGNVGSVIWIDGPCWPIDTTYFVETELPLRFVAEQLRRTKFLNTHAAVPGLSREQAYSKPFLQPPSKLVDNFQSVADSLAGEGSTLANQSERLASMRDLLLPKLVAGQIDVSSLDLDSLVEGAVA